MSELVTPVTDEEVERALVADDTPVADEDRVVEMDEVPAGEETDAES